MNNTQKHIIGTCRWITQFDSKKKSFALQSEISEWSKYQMLREIDWVLNEVCPPDKTMIIDTLELDIGMLTYENLHQELPLVFSEKLKETLRSMIRSSGKGESNLRIITQDQNYFDTLQYFLQFGYVSNGLSQEENLQSIIELLLTNHRVQAVQMIRILLKEENVRKRIAWQFKDETIKKIVKELEPNNYDYIIDFTDQVISIQQKEDVLKTSLSDFKKNLWFWVFNYLFVERGTMFNKIAFVRSTLIQMANHFNFKYDELFELIEAAVSHIDHHKKGEFLSILRTLYSQKKRTGFISKTSKKENDQYWQELKLFLKDKSTRVLSEKKGYFNELIVNLYRQNPSEFKNIITKVGEKESDWVAIVQDLTPPSMEVVFRTINADEGDAIYKQIKALEQLQIKKVFQVSSEEIISIAISYTIQTRSQSHTTKSMLNYVIQKLSSKNTKAKEAFFKGLFDEELTVNKSQELFGITHELEDLYKAQLTEKLTPLTKTRFSKLIKNQGNSSNQKELEVWLESQPEKVWKLIIKEEKLFQDFTEKLPLTEAKKLLQTIGYNYQKLIQKMQEMLLEFQQNISNKQITIIALQVLKKFNLPNESQFMNELAKRLIWKSTSVIEKKDFLEVIHRMENYTEPILLTEELELHFFKEELQKKTLFDICLNEIKKEELPKKDILNKINMLIRNGNVETKTLEAHEKTLVFYVFGKKSFDKDTIFNKLKVEVSRLYKDLSMDAFEEVLIETYWESLIKYEIHNGTVSLWEKLFKETISHKYPRLIQSKHLEKKIDFSKKKEITIKDIEESPEEIKAWIRTSKDEKKILQMLKKELSAEEFHGLLFPIIGSITQPYFEAFLLMMQVLKSKIQQSEIRELEIDFWEYTIQLVRGKKPDALLRKLINTVIGKLNLNKDFDQNALVEGFVKVGLHEFIHIEYERTSGVVYKQDNAVQLSIENNQIEPLIEYLFKNQEIPVWFDNQDDYTHISLFKELIIRQPHKVIQILRMDQRYVNTFENIAPTIELIEVLGRLYVHQSTVLKHVSKLYQLLGTLSGFSISAAQWQQALMKIVLRCWVHSNWKPITGSHLWMELLWEINKVSRISKKQFVSAIGSIKSALPTVLLTALKYIEDTKETNQSKPIQFMKKMAVGIPIRNSGLVILNTYFKILFDRLGLLNANDFTNEEAQEKAIHYLQYIVTGLTETEESLLVLNKILCGVDIELPIKESIDMDPKDKALIDGMIESSIAYWSSIGTTSVEGFRGNWLVRDGVLKEEAERWELTVEKRSYDILMQKSPFSFSIIKLPWMKKPLHVIWPF